MQWSCVPARRGGWWSCPLQTAEQAQLFFKWIKQHVRIKAFYGTSINAVKMQVWID